MMRALDAPIERAALTYSRFFCLRNSERVWRATGGHEMMPIARTIVLVYAPKSATTTSANRRPGRTWKNSVTFIRARSTTPP